MPLQVNDVLTTQYGDYHIQSILGRGATCIAYIARRSDDTMHILKEFAPAARAHMSVEALEAAKARFLHSCELQKRIRNEIVELANSVCNIQGVFEIEDTPFQDISVLQGNTYDKTEETSLYDCLRRIYTLTRVVEAYHRAGYLCLDLKPENIFTIPETPEMVYFFDFDSIFPKSQLQADANSALNSDGDNDITLSFTPEWAAYELIDEDSRGFICDATDLYAIGEILFTRLFGRHSKSIERRANCTFRFDPNQALFNNVDASVFPVLSRILQHTLPLSITHRYADAQEFMADLEQAIALANPNSPRLISRIVPPKDFFIGRDSLMADLRSALTECKVVVLSGEGGIGKSELAKNYLALHAKENSYTYFTTYSGSWRSYICDDTNLPIANFSMANGESPDAYFERKMKKLRDLCDAKTFIVIDNVNETEYSAEENTFYQQIMALPCRFLITSRSKEFSYRVIAVDTLTSQADRRALFAHFCPYAPADEPDVDRLIDYFQGHTMAIELTALHLKATFQSAGSLLARLVHNGASGLRQAKIRMDKDGTATKDTLLSHFCTLFDLSGLSDDQKRILVCMAVMPSSGIPADDFLKLTNIRDMDSLTSLISLGYVNQHDIGCDTSIRTFFSIHPIVREVTYNCCELQLVDSFLTSLYVSFEEQNLPDSELAIIAKYAANVIRTLTAPRIGYNSDHLAKLISSSILMSMDNTFTIPEYINLCIDGLKIISEHSADHFYIRKQLIINLAAAYIFHRELSKVPPLLEQLSMDLFRLNPTSRSAIEAKIHDLWGGFYYSSREFASAIQHESNAVYIQTHVIEHNTLPMRYPYELRRLCGYQLNLASAYSANGQKKESEELELQVLHTLQTQLTNLKVMQAHTLGALCSLRIAANDYPMALHYAQNELKLSRSLFGDDSMYVANAYYDLGDCNLLNNFKESALYCFRKSYDLTIRYRDKDASDVLNILDKIAECSENTI